jgi:uncharacterized protein (TIGR03000 family)
LFQGCSSYPEGFIMRWSRSSCLVVLISIATQAESSSLFAQMGANGPGIAIGIGSYGGFGPGYGFGPGPYFGRGYGYGPYYGGMASSAGFYSFSGYSTYGPPVPTYGVTPGAFGGSDASSLTRGGIPLPRKNNFTTHWLGERSAYQPWAPSHVSPYAPPLNPSMEINTIRMLPILIEVKVPESAVVTLDGKPTTSAGLVRVFRSPDLPTDKSFDYDIVATWKEGEKPVTKSKTISGKPGERLTVDFSGVN